MKSAGGLTDSVHSVLTKSSLLLIVSSILSSARGDDELEEDT